MGTAPGLIGRALNDTYRISELIGEGGFADVFLGRDLRTNVVVAIKVLHAHLGRDPGIVERFLHEAWIAQKLTDPHIVHVLDSGLDGDVHFIVMEYVTGHTLAHLLKVRGPMPVEQAVDYISQTLMALADAHRHGILHRDIKPQNIMVTASGLVKVMDFGIAKDLAAEGATAPASLMGTPRYMSPEQAQGEPATAASDLYAVAITFYELLRGQPPFSAETAWKILNLHINAPPPPITDARSDVPEHLQRALGKGLAKDPTLRFASAEEMLFALQHGPLNSPADMTIVEVSSPDVNQAPVRNETLATSSATDAVKPAAEASAGSSVGDRNDGAPEKATAAETVAEGAAKETASLETSTVAPPDQKVPDVQAPGQSTSAPADERLATRTPEPLKPLEPATSVPSAKRGLPLPFLAGGGAVLAALLVGGVIFASRGGSPVGPTGPSTPAASQSPVVATATLPAATATVGSSPTRAAANGQGAINAAGFPTTAGQDNGYRFSVKQDVYTLNLEKPQSWYVTLARPVVDNMKLSVDARLTDANAKGSYLIAFRANTLADCYLFGVNPTLGTFSLTKRAKGEETALIPETTWPSIKRGSQVNHLNVNTQGTTITLIINGEVVATIDDSSYLKGHVGLGGRSTASPATIEYRGLEIGPAGG